MIPLKMRCRRLGRACEEKFLADLRAAETRKRTSAFVLIKIESRSMVFALVVSAEFPAAAWCHSPKGQEEGGICEKLGPKPFSHRCP